MIAHATSRLFQALIFGGGRGSVGRDAKEVSDFNADAGTLAIRQSKSGKPRHVVLTQEGAAFFGQCTAGRAGSESMFRRDDGSAWARSDQHRPMKEARANGKIRPAISFHILRHTWASLAVMAGVPLMVVAKNLGHRDTRMVERHYGHLAPGFIADAIRAGAPRYNVQDDKRVVPLRSPHKRTSGRFWGLAGHPGGPPGSGP